MNKKILKKNHQTNELINLNEKFNDDFFDKPVLLSESIDYLNIKKNGIYVDCTFGSGWHSQKILEKINDQGKLYSFDCDQNAYQNLKRNSIFFQKNFHLINENFKNIKEVLKSKNIEKVDGIIYDLGFSILQINDPKRGFSYNRDGPLDMRMDKSNQLTANYIVNNYSENQLREIIKVFGEEKFAKKIAREIVKERERKIINSTLEFSQIIKNALPKKNMILRKHHPCKKTFQALRIEVNSELDNLKISLNNAFSLLKKNSRIIVISFHSLEDRIVKNIFKNYSQSHNIKLKVAIVNTKIQKYKILTKKPLIANQEKIKLNPRIRSAKLRCIEKIN
jgi:16S rRNA (cytosine1402-N4)-methyltransferase